MLSKGTKHGDFFYFYRLWTTSGRLPNNISTKMDDGKQPLFTFGVIADIQYADIGDGFNFLHTRKRYYRNSLTLLRRANQKWKSEAVQPSFILQLGDIIDGFNKQHDASEKALQTVINELQQCNIEIHHIWGNHEFYNFSRDDLMNSVLNSKTLEDASNKQIVENSTEPSYSYHFSPAPNFRFVLLDAYDLSLLGRKEPSQKYCQSLQIIQEHNKNENLNHPPGYAGMEARFVQFNGGFSKAQLEWLDKVLTFSDNNMEKVTVISHLPIHPGATDPICLAWNYEEVLSILHSHKSVVCFMAGHDHDGGYFLDESGVHHLTFEGVIETPPDSDAFGTVYVYEDRMILKGNGRVLNRVLMYP
ncbi:ADPRM diphosphatase, partial [Atractosteus spatula]|nr:ADPRM diphosphatase [Atractosteus spatula]